MRSIDRHASNLLLLALQLWGLLLGLPLLKVALEARADPIELIVEALLMPTPRWIFGLVCALPVFPLAVQWILGGLYVTYAWLTLWEHLAKSRRTWALEPGTGRGWAILGPALVLVAAGLLFARHSIRDSVIDLEEPPSSRAEHVSVDGAAPLLLGEGLEAAMEERSFAAATATVSLTLAEGEVARVDALTSAPPVTTDVYQVDRSQDGPEIGSGTDPGPDEGGGGADYKLLALSAIASTDPGMPGQLRLLVADKLERSPHVGWRLEPGRHTLSITVAAPLAWVTVNGRIMDLRTDVPIGTQIGAARVMSMTPGVSQVHRLAIWSPDTTLLSTVQSRSTTADLVGAFALIVLILGIGASILALVPLSLDRTTVVVGLLKALRAHTLLLVWLGFWLAGRLTGFSWGDDPWQQTYGAIAVLFSVVNLAQVLRQSRPDRTRTQRAVGWVALAVVFTVGIEGVSHLSPEWRHNWTTYWSHGLSPKWYYVQDPMIRRLNPWFIDQRFKRRDWAPTHPDKTRIVVFGGSQTYGWGIPAMDRMAFSDQLERALVSGGHTDVEVLNASFPGVKTATGLRWFASNLLRYEPDIVVINFVVNEFMNVDQYHVWSGDVGPDDRISWLSLGAFAEKWRGRIMGNHLSQIIVANVYEVYAMEQCLRWWVDIAEKQGVKVVFSIEPTNLYVESGGDAIMQGETALGDAQGVYRTLGKELGIPVYDALPHFAKEQENMWFYDTMHMSRLGHRVFAENLAGLIETEYLVKTP